MTPIPETHEEVWLNHCPTCQAEGKRVPINILKVREIAHCAGCDTYWPKIIVPKRRYEASV